jgi:cytochrome c peroxidase
MSLDCAPATGQGAGDLGRREARPQTLCRRLELRVVPFGPDVQRRQFHNLGLPVLPGEKPDLGRAAGIRLLRADIFHGAGAFSDDPTGTAKQKLEFLPSAGSQLGAFKTPSPRNVALPAPYMQDGRFATLQQVMQFYARVRRQAEAPRRHARGHRQPCRAYDHWPASGLIAFLETLTGAPLAPSLIESPRISSAGSHRMP